ncbi:DUF4062 domain-containing protein [Oceanobacter mangrovi]|uniref:DUF4062 domain-containing protein n=1 Tax=Oceanobacter mangrovi TaxID=2862510 RepID=UPI001C8E2391|nr:DUF4062 domain-containing protein [Oceanobacter mangrovi]
MPEKYRHMVYLASNMDGLELERYEIQRLLARNGMIDVGIACPPAGVNYDWNLVRQQIEMADLFILLTGDSYGPVTQTGISHLHREYVHARTLDIPVIGFLKKLPTGNLNPEQLRLKGFYQMVTQQISYKLWHLRDELLAYVKSNLKSIQPTLGVGWSPADPVPETPQLPAPRPQAIAPGISAREKMELSRKEVKLVVSAKVYEGGNLTPEEVILPARLDQLFRALQGSFTSSTSEDRIRAGLESVISDTVRKQLLGRRPSAHAVDDIKLSKIQFRSILESWQLLGLVEHQFHSGRDFWKAIPEASRAGTA